MQQTTSLSVILYIYIQTPNNNIPITRIAMQPYLAAIPSSSIILIYVHQ